MGDSFLVSDGFQYFLPQEGIYETMKVYFKDLIFILLKVWTGETGRINWN